MKWMPESEPRSSYRVEVASRDDLDKINAAFPPPEDDPKQHQDSLDLQESGRGAFYLSRSDDDIGGYVTVLNDHQSVHFDEIKGSFITGLMVDSKHRGQGLGKMLVAKCEDYVKSRGGKEIFLIVESDNEKAMGLYKKGGYKEMPGKTFTLPEDVDPEQIESSYLRKDLT